MVFIVVEARCKNQILGMFLTLIEVCLSESFEKQKWGNDQKTSLPCAYHVQIV